MTAEHEALRLLYVRDTLMVCGPGKTILNTWRTIDRARFHITIVATRPAEGECNLLLERARTLGARVVALKIGRGVDLVAVWRLIRLLRRERIDVLQTHDAQTRRIGVIAAALTGTRHFTSVHGWIFNERKEKIAKWLDARLIRQADRVITVSEKLKRELEAVGVPDNKISVLRNGILLEDYTSSQRAATELRRALAIPQNHRVVSIIGRLSPEKGHEVFFEAASLLAGELPNVTCLVVGDGHLDGLLKERAAALKDHPRIVFTGHQEDLSGIYAATDVLVISSFSEGIPNVLLEAAANHVPAVATRVGGIPEVIEDGKTGFLVSVGNAREIANRILTLLRSPDLRRQMGDAARAAVERNFSFLGRTRALERLYSAVPADADGR